MRKIFVSSALLGLVALGLPAVAPAAPIVTLVAKAVPIPGFPGTGNKLGAGAAVEAKYTISGHESTGGVPSQITGVTFYLPAGTKLHPQGFVTCAPSVLENTGPSGCPKKSQASPIGTAGVVDPIGGELVKENATLQAFFAPGGGLEFYANAASPISAQLLVAKGSFSPASSPFGWKLTTAVQLVQSVPGAPPVSTESINIKVGAAYRKGRKTIYYGTLPKRCPRGGFPVKSEITFATNETVTATYRAPCPKGARGHKARRASHAKRHHLHHRVHHRTHHKVHKRGRHRRH
jgi:hypothetical protein